LLTRHVGRDFAGPSVRRVPAYLQLPEWRGADLGQQMIARSALRCCDSCERRARAVFAAGVIAASEALALSVEHSLQPSAALV
jgi:hypothetical protein